jgi:thymidylate kinase
MNGKLFVIEGLDGSGKQTQTQLLYERLHAQG